MLEQLLKEGKVTRRVERILLLVFLAVVPVLAACGGGGASGLTVAPDFTAQEADGGQVALSEALGESKNVVLVFYRGVF